MEFYMNPNKIYCKSLYISCNDPLEPKGVLFEGIKDIHLSSHFKQLLSRGDIPSSVEKLTIESGSECFNSNNTSQDILPPSIKELNISNLDQSFNNLVNLVPPNVEKFISDYNSFITPNQLPSSITELDLYRFNQRLEIGSIPPSVIKLSLGSFILPIRSNYLPPSIKELSLDWYIGSLQHLPPNLEILSLMSYYTQFEQGDLPNSLIELKLYKYNLPLSNLPPNLQKLTLNGFNQVIKKNDLPPSLTSIKFYRFNQDINQDTFPSSIQTINMGILFNKPIQASTFPIGVTGLNLGSSFNQSISDHQIPPTCKYLILGNSFQFEIKKNDIPDSVQVLSFANKYDKPSPASLLSNFSLRSPSKPQPTIYYNHPINNNNIPKSLEILAVHNDSNTDFINLPNNIKIIKSYQLDFNNNYLF